MEIGIGVKIIVAIIVLHLIGGFGYAIYMVSPRKGDKDKSNGNEITEEGKNIENQI